MEKYITIKWDAPEPIDHILDEEHQSKTEQYTYNATSRLYYVTGVNARTKVKRIYIGKAGDTSVLGRLKDHMKKHDILNGCADVQVRIGAIVNTGGLNVDCNDVDLVDQTESILIHEFKNFKKDIGDKMKDNEQKVDSYTKYYDIKGIHNQGDIDEMPKSLNIIMHNAIEK